MGAAISRRPFFIHTGYPLSFKEYTLYTRNPIKHLHYEQPTTHQWSSDVLMSGTTCMGTHYSCALVVLGGIHSKNPTHP